MYLRVPCRDIFRAMKSTRMRVKSASSKLHFDLLSYTSSEDAMSKNMSRLVKSRTRFEMVTGADRKPMEEWSLIYPS